MKLLSDFKKITGCSNKDKIIFLDDQYHDYMDKKKVTYLHLKPYRKNISNKILLNRFLRSNNNKIVKLEDWEEFISLYNIHYGEDKEEDSHLYHMHDGNVTSSQIFPAVKKFIEDNGEKTLKKKKKQHKKTRKL